ncbi:hypothetical protein [Sphingobium sp. MK2]|uniref:hypothetical protein n=1 Tax=Sphingobium sp. MK2 TaxID=3116540 RepID=UPI0032E364BE
MRDIPDNSEDTLDSRDIVARIDELEEQRGDLESELEEAQDALQDAATELLDADPIAQHNGPDPSGELAAAIDKARAALAEWDASDEAEELKTLKAFRDELTDYCDDWSHGVTLIRDSYFKEYAEQLADDIGAINGDAKWPVNCIDWEKAARELQMDYTSGEFDGVTYWAR